MISHKGNEYRTDGHQNIGQHIMILPAVNLVGEIVGYRLEGKKIIWLVEIETRDGEASGVYMAISDGSLNYVHYRPVRNEYE